MTTQAAPVAKPIPAYIGPIFDADSHIRGQNRSFLQKDLSEKYTPDWLVAPRVGPNGMSVLCIGDCPLENMECTTGNVPPPGKLREWLRAIATGK
jgi:hypothetical protein